MDKKSRGVTKPKRGQANKRERVRTENVNAGFENLRKLIPTDPEDRKLSKIEVLRLATSYINHLFNLTRANSCLESEAIEKNIPIENIENDGSDSDHEGSQKDSDFSGAQEGKSDARTVGKSSRSHVCTFCLMMTKTTSPLTSAKRK